MKKLAKLFALALIVIGISACGKMGELEHVKADQMVLTKTPANTQAIDETTQVIAPELDILPHNSK